MRSSAALLVLLTACATARTAPEAAHAELRDAAGTLLGRITLSPEGGATRVSGVLQGVTPGAHGLHVHAVGRCEPPFASAGGHFNPAQRPHGLAHPQGGHAGDLPNVTADASGRVTVDALARAPLDGEGGILDADGAALVLHEGADDDRTDPAGNSGARVACGVITR